jgi:ankyrin repeat protein
VPRNLPTRALREHPNLDQLRRQAKELLAAFRAGEEGAVAEVAAHYHGADAATFALHDAQLVLARSYGFESWPKLKAHVDGVTVRRLADAVRAGDAEGVRAMLGARPELVNLAMAWNDEHTALHHAVLGRMPEMVRILMEHGADARAGISPHNDATTALTIATDRGYDEIVAIIREEERRREGGRPIPDEAHEELREAMRSGDEDRAIEILGRHPDLAGLPDRRDGWTPLHAASALLLPGVIAWLLDHGADVGRRAKDGSAPPDVVGRWSGDAERAGRSAAVVSLLRKQGAQLTARSAVIAADEAALRALHAEGALSAPLDDQGGLLGLAVGNGRPEILKLLLDLGLDPDARARVEGVEDVTFTWGMPLWDCARHGKHEMARMLLERGADPNAQVYASGTPLSEAYGQRDEEMIALLERFGGRSNAAMAGMYRRADLARRLLAEGEEGAASLPDDGFGSGPVAEQLASGAARGGDPEILRMALGRVDIPAGDPRWAGLLVAPLEMWNHGPWPWAHHEWDRRDYLACFRMILERCGNPDARLRFGMTVLHEVAASHPHVRPEERVAFATMLLDAGARTDLRDDLLKSTPLGWACRWGRAELVRLLLERGADPVEAGAEPWATPRAWARRMGRDEVLALLPGGKG